MSTRKLPVVAALAGALVSFAALPLSFQKAKQPSAPQIEPPLTCTFLPGTESEYRIQLTVRSELTGEQSDVTGSLAHVHPISRVAAEGISWRATRRVLGVDTGGLADIEEVLDDFSAIEKEPVPPATAADTKEAAKLDEALITFSPPGARPGRAVCITTRPAMGNCTTSKPPARHRSGRRGRRSSSRGCCARCGLRRRYPRDRSRWATAGRSLAPRNSKDGATWKASRAANGCPQPPGTGPRNRP